MKIIILNKKEKSIERESGIYLCIKLERSRVRQTSDSSSASESETDVDAYELDDYKNFFKAENIYLIHVFGINEIIQ